MNRIIKKIFYYPKGSWNYLVMNLLGIINKSGYKNGKVNLKKECIKQIKLKTSFFTDNLDILADWVSNTHIVSLADKVLLSEKTNWLQDDQSSYIWGCDYYLKIRNNLFKGYGSGKDIKNVWDKSRFFDAPILALAYLKTKNRKYLTHFENLLLDWNKSNPWGYGPNWTVALEVSIRVCNLILAFKIFEKGLHEFKQEFSPEFKNKFLISVIEHGKFIEKNLERFPNKTNHFLGDLLGLIYIGFAFPELKKSKAYILNGLKWLGEEMENQVGEDGVDKEGSMQYHRFKLEMFTYGLLLYKENENLGFKLNVLYWKKLHKMFEYVFLYTKPNQLSTQLGDTDGSRLHILEDLDVYSALNHTYLFNVYGLVFHDSSKMFDVGKQCHLLKESGIGIMKNKRTHLIMGRNNPKNNKYASHFHNDIGSFELNVDGKDFIIDPGTYCYTEDLGMRNMMRSTFMHNTVALEIEQNPLEVNEPFFINFTSKKSTKTNIVWKDEYERCKYVIDWRIVKTLISRSVTLDKQADEIEIIDLVTGSEFELQWLFHLSPEVKVLEENGVLVLNNSGTVVKMSFPVGFRYEIKDDIVSYGLHQKTNSKTLCFKTKHLDKKKEYLFKFKF